MGLLFGNFLIPPPTPTHLRRQGGGGGGGGGQGEGHRSRFHDQKVPMKIKNFWIQSRFLGKHVHVSYCPLPFIVVRVGVKSMGGVGGCVPRSWHFYRCHRPGCSHGVTHVDH